MSTDLDQNWGPPMERTARRRRWPKLLALLLVLVLIATVAFALWLSQQLTRMEVANLASSGGPMHILVLGSDSRDDLTPEERVELSTGSEGGNLSDTIFVMSIDGGDVAMLSFPRDLWVTRCDGSIGRINAATNIDGPGCMVRTVRDLSGIEVNHVMEMTFGGFRDLVDAVGGVDLCLDEPINDQDAGIDLPGGCQRLDGADSLGFVRVRKIDNDLMRIERQQQFVRALAREVASPSTLLNPVRLNELARDSGEAVRVDQNMGPIALARLGLAVRGLGGGSSISNTVPGDPRTTSGGAAVLEMRVNEAESLFAAHRNGTIFDQIERSDDTTEAVRPQDVQVTVLNGAGVAGLAGAVGEDLEERGYDVTDIGNADQQSTTVIRYAPGDEAAARLVAGATPGAGTLEEISGTTGIVVVLGSDAGGT
jgi:LCP family protein required for cell wall assembly